MERELPLTFDPDFKKLGREIARFANHTKRLVAASQKHRRILEAASMWSEGTAPLDRRPESPLAALRAIDDFARHRRDDRAQLLGAYFAHHHLRNQAELARQLLREALGTDPKRRVASCHRAYAQADAERTEWVAGLLELVIAASAPGLSESEYAAFNVGALTDHEDVDLAIVVASEEAGQALARGFTNVSKTFVRFASRIQLFLGEQLERSAAGATVEEYEQLLEHPGEKVVAITQLLGAQFLCGSRELERTLEDHVCFELYAGRGSPLVHQTYLRKVAAELKHFLSPGSVPGVLSPKREIYLPSKLVVAAMRVIHGVSEPRIVRALELLALEDPEHAQDYHTLSDAFVQNEVLRALLFLYVSPSETLDVADETVRSCSRRVATLLGLGASARRTPEIRLAGAYADLRAQAHRSIAAISTSITRHLGRVSSLRQVFEQRDLLYDARENVAVRLLDTLESYHDSVFWDEAVELIASTPETGRRFVEGLSILGPRARAKVVRRYVELMSEDAAALIELLVFVATEVEGRDHAPAFWRAMLEILRESPDRLARFVARLDGEERSEALYRLAAAHPPASLAALADLVERGRDTPRAARVARALRSALVLVHHSSHALGRLSSRVLGRTPELLERIGDPRRLKDLSQELLAQSARELVPREQMELVGDAFDVARLRASLTSVLDALPPSRDADVSASADLYVRELFKACFRDVHARSPIFEHYRPGIGVALYVTGGYGRGEAFGADWDYFAVVDGDDRGLKKFFGKVLQRVESELARRGLPAHNRFSGHFNAYVASLPELLGYFAGRTAETFIDEAEVLESRFLLGDPVVARRFEERIVGHVLRENGRTFVGDILGELRSRRARPPARLNVKLSPGGLREIHLLWLALRVHVGLPGPLVPALLPLVTRALPGHARELRFLMGAADVLRRVRDLYRLVVAIDDAIEPERLVHIARDLAPLARAGLGPDFAPWLEGVMVRVAARVDVVAAELERRVGREHALALENPR
ncbi:hypothetical protein L6R52_15290 [Myxococcota bacterium]|nr:hypothetical protein [Myxococcota bacterium]